MQVQYTDEELLDCLRECKELNGYCSPNIFSEMEDMPSQTTIMRRFGSWTNAKEKAGIEENLQELSGRRQKYSDEEILEDLRECERRNGDCSASTLRKEDDLVSVSVAIERFDGWVEAKEAAGLVPDGRKSNQRPRKYSNEEYCEFIRRCEEKHGKATKRLFNSDDEFPSAAAVRKRFGSWGAGKRAAGIDDKQRDYTDEELLDMMRECEQKYGKVTAAVFAADADFCAPETIQRRFGGWNNAKELL